MYTQRDVIVIGAMHAVVLSFVLIFVYPIIGCLWVADRCKSGSG